MTGEEFVEKNLLKLGTAIPIWRSSRCGDYESELGPGENDWWDYGDQPFEKNMKCVSNTFTYRQSFYEAEKFCKKVISP